MRKEEVDRWARARPFLPFEVRLVDGQRFRFTSMEQLLVSRSAIMTLDEDGVGMFISLDMIATVRALKRNGRSGNGRR